MNKSKRSGKLIMALGVVFILSSLALVLYNNYTESKAQKLSAEVLSQLDMENVVTTAPVDEFTPPDYVVNPNMFLPKKTVDGNDYVGKLSVPALELNLPVMSEWSYDNFKIAPCVYEGTPYKNNFIIAAHNYDTHFAYLRTLEQGDEVTFKDMDGNVFCYEVMYVEIIDNNAVEQMSAGEWDLTLFTCTYGGATRVTARCRAVEFQG